MSDNQDNIQEGLGNSPSESTESKPDNIQDKPNISEAAAKQGYKSYEEYVAAGGKPEMYQSPEVFMALKEPLKTIRQKTKELERKEREFDERLKSQRDFHNEQLKLQREKLMADRDAAIVNSDVQQAQHYQQQIDNMPTQMEEPAPTKSTAIAEWEAKNPWVQQPGPKTAYANAQFSHYLSQNYTQEDALRMVDQDISREFADVNPTARKAPIPEGGSPPGNTKAPSRNLTMNDLTAEERSIWKNSSSMWGGDEKKFLQAVKDSRSEG